MCFRIYLLTPKTLSFLFLLALPFFSPAQTYLMGNTTLSTCSGTFLDPGGNSDYPINCNYTMVINPATAGQYATVNFSWIDIQQDWDVLYAYDGNSAAAPLLGIFTGTVSPGTIKASTANATRSLTFRFVSNAWSVSAEPGWSATISCSATGASPMYCMKNGATYTVCSGTFYDSGGPTQTYTWNENAVTTFCPGTAGSGTQLVFSPIDLEQDGDLLYLYDGPTIASPLIAGFGNSDNVVLPAQTITASTANTTGCLTAKFVSDGWWQNSGWSAAISCAPKTAPRYAVADETVSACSGTFTDNGGGNATYMNFSSDQFTLCSDNVTNPYVSVTFSGLDLWTGFDFLKVYNGNSTAAALIANYTGIIGPTSVSSANASGCLTFEFLSDGFTTRAGWSASIGCSSVIALPVRWLGFSGERKEEGIVLDWKTASETDSWYFSVERYNGQAFESIGSVNAAGNSSQTLHYTFTDTDPLNDWNYYRLKEYDHNGQFEYSGILAIGPSKGDAQVQLRYRENGEPYLLLEHLEDRALNIRIYEASGALVAQTEHSSSSPYEQFPIDVTSLSQGIYLLEIGGADFRQTLSLLKQ